MDDGDGKKDDVDGKRDDGNGIRDDGHGIKYDSDGKRDDGGKKIMVMENGKNKCETLRLMQKKKYEMSMIEEVGN